MVLHLNRTVLYLDWIILSKTNWLIPSSNQSSSSKLLTGHGAHWARIRKKVQKPPQSTHLISRSEWPPHSTQYVFKGSIFCHLHILLAHVKNYDSLSGMWRVFFPKKRVYQTMVKLTLDELWCFPQKELIPFLGGSHLTEWKSKSDLAHFLAYFNTFWVECGGV